MAKVQRFSCTNKTIVAILLIAIFCITAMNIVLLQQYDDDVTTVDQYNAHQQFVPDTTEINNNNNSNNIINNNNENNNENIQSLVHNNTNKLLLQCKQQDRSSSSSSSSNSSSYYLSQTDARQIIKDFVQERTEQNGRPRFVPVLNKLMEASSDLGVSLMTFQLGGMDGKTGDPMYRMTQFQKNLTHWEPVVVEPVPVNFQKLAKTYRAHQEEKGLKCPHLLHQLISYNNYDGNNNDNNYENNNNNSSSKKCHFCHFDPSKADTEVCKKFPEHLKHETGSMECNNKHNSLKSQCFMQETYTCGTIVEALRSNGLSSENVVVLQIDVEGFEQKMISGYLDEIPPEHYPAVINFESRVIKQRGELDAVFQTLREKGYGIHEKRVDTLALMGAQGLLLDNV